MATLLEMGMGCHAEPGAKAAGWLGLYCLNSPLGSEAGLSCHFGIVLVPWLSQTCVDEAAGLMAIQLEQVRSQIRRAIRPIAVTPSHLRPV